jgi:transcriptional regulator GlxA family with amidase domain
MTKTVAESAPSVEIGLVCDAGTSDAGVYGLADLFRYAGDFAAKRRANAAGPVVRICHWRAEDDADAVVCGFDNWPGAPHAPDVLIIPGNERATQETAGGEALTAWLRRRHADGVVLAAVCGGVFLLARTGVLDGRQATTH